ncbi:MAG: GDSL-type esterase/lipase family protein [Phycisphaerales bacterium]
MRRVVLGTCPICVCLLIAFVPGQSSLFSQPKSGGVTPQNGEITDHFRRMLRYHLRMDGNVPDGSVLFIGDSLVQGLCTDAVACPSVNYGIGQDTTVGVLTRLPQYRSLLRASALVLEIGANDMSRRDNQQIIENYRQILDAVPRSVPVVCSAVLPVNERLLSPPDESANARIRDFNVLLETLCSADSRCVFVNPANRLVDADGNLAAALQDGDGVHPNSDGNRIWIDELRAALQKARAHVSSVAP